MSSGMCAWAELETWWPPKLSEGPVTRRVPWCWDTSSVAARQLPLTECWPAAMALAQSTWSIVVNLATWLPCREQRSFLFRCKKLCKGREQCRPSCWKSPIVCKTGEGTSRWFWLQVKARCLVAREIIKLNHLAPIQLLLSMWIWAHAECLCYNTFLVRCCGWLWTRCNSRYSALFDSTCSLACRDRKSVV